MRTDFEFLALERVDDHVLVVTYDRPEVANAKNTKMGEEQREVFESLYVDQEDVRCVILTGRGKHFSAGADLKERNGMTDAQWQRQHAIYEQGAVSLKACPVPIIAAVNGAAYGGGCETALGCDFIYASTKARFALTEITLGIIPGTMGTQHLTHAAGDRRAKEIIMTGLPFSAEEGYEWGIVNRVCEPDDLLEAALQTAQRISSNAPLAVMRAKRSVTVARHTDTQTGYLYELEAYNRLVTTEDRREGVLAFNEKRKPNFKGK
jgi:enoyl-CoA hydratase